MKIALALCGGGSLGSYEVGAIEKLYEKGLSFDIVTGSSVGALNGFFVATHDFKKLISFWENIEMSNIIKDGFNTNKAAISKIFENRAKQVRTLLVSYIQNIGLDIAPYKELLTGAMDLSKLKKPDAAKLGVVYTSYPSMKENRKLVNDEDDEAIMDYFYASSACFPIFPLHKIGNKYYIDGGYSNNLPINYAFDLGADYVYAVGLRSFPPVPQFRNYQRLPNVKFIMQSRSLGFMMDFDPKTLSRNRMMGYLDAGRVLGDYYGETYAFKKDEKDLEKAHAFVMKALAKGAKGFDSLKSLFGFKASERVDEISFYIAGIEYIAKAFQVDEFHLYSIDSMLEAIKEKAANLNESKKKQPKYRYLSELVLGTKGGKPSTKGLTPRVALIPPLL